jgi:magnesium-transporting ATPase (P-type)
MTFLSLCHTVTKYKGSYGASSPDELAIVNFSKKCGFEFLEKDGDDNLIIKVLG